MERVEAQVQRIAGTPTGSIRLAIFATAIRSLLIDAVSHLRTHAPTVTVRPDEVDPVEAIDAVASGTHDLAVVHSWGGDPLPVPDGLLSRTLGVDRASVLIHRDHALASQAVVHVEQLVDEAWVATAPGTICHRWIGQMFQPLGRAPEIVCVASEFSTHIELVAAGLAVALVPHLGRGVLPPTVVPVRVEQPECIRTVSLAWRATMDDRPALHAVVDAFAATATDLTPPT